MATYKVFNLREAEWLTVEATTVRKALLKAIELFGQSSGDFFLGKWAEDNLKIEIGTTTDGNHLATMGDFALRISNKEYPNGQS